MTEITEKNDPFGNKYKLLNTYIAFAREGHLALLECPDCGNEYTLWIPDDDHDLERPVLKCWTCNAEVTLSNYTLHQIKEALRAVKNTLQRDEEVGDSAPPKDGGIHQEKS